MKLSEGCHYVKKVKDKSLQYKNLSIEIVSILMLP